MGKKSLLFLIFAVVFCMAGCQVDVEQEKCTVKIPEFSKGLSEVDYNDSIEITAEMRY